MKKVPKKVLGRMKDTLKRGISHYLYHSLIRPKFNYSY